MSSEIVLHFRRNVNFSSLKEEEPLRFCVQRKSRGESEEKKFLWYEDERLEGERKGGGEHENNEQVCFACRIKICLNG